MTTESMSPLTNATIAELVVEPVGNVLKRYTNIKIDVYGLPAGQYDLVLRDGAPFQQRVQPWMQECFGPAISADKVERNHRFFEESAELVQAAGMTRSEAHQLVDYVFGRPAGEKAQEIGGVMVTLAALCLAQGIDMHAAGEAELARIWTKVEQIRAKQAAKPKYSPLPEHADARQPQPSAEGVSDTNYAEQAPLPEDVREFLVGVSKQEPEKPDYWSSCGQCARNTDRAQDLLALRDGGEAA